jgi:spore germination protein YaaH
MVWHYIDSIENNGYLPGMLADTKDLNVIAPTWFVLGDAQGNLISYADGVYAERARGEYGLSLWAMISDYTGEDSSTGEILSNAENRQNIITQMMDMALTYGLEGFNIDFETITSDQAPAFLQFLRELTSAAHAAGIYVSVDNYVPLYTRYYRRDEQARIVDYLFIMGYDEHTGRSPEIGSVASLPFVEEGVTDTLEEAPAEQVVLGVPFFTRGWTEPFGSAEFESQWLDMTEIEGWVQEHGITLNWDPTMGQYTGSADGADARYTIWSEDARSLGEKLKLIEKYGLAGACAWRVGIETADVWDTWQTILQ